MQYIPLFRCAADVSVDDVVLTNPALLFSPLPLCIVCIITNSGASDRCCHLLRSGHLFTRNMQYFMSIWALDGRDVETTA
jgi:hypothetical protein